MSKEKLSGETAAPSTIELLQKELKQGGTVLDTLNEQLTQTLYDSLSGYGVMTDLDSLYDIIEKSVKTSISVWAGGSKEPIVSHDAQQLAEEQRAENPDLDTRKQWNNPDENIALAGSLNADERARYEKATKPEEEPAKKNDKKKADK